MSVNNKVHKHLGGIIFVACMFLGMGIGMLFDRSGAGCLIGMGVGFVLMGLFMSGILKLKTTETIRITVKSTVILASLVFTGVLFIGIGVGIIFNIEMLVRYMSGLFCIAIGILLITLGIYVAQHIEKTHEDKCS